jgi:glucose-6-phosphate dehydrogenase assembly protein OpcA
MAAALADRAWRPSALERIETDLTAVWEELAREAPVSRAAMSNLVVFCRCPADITVDLALPPEGVPLEEVASQHPARVIVLRHDPDVAAGAPATVPEARVGVVTFGPHDARYGVEAIVIRSACAEAALPSIVRPLLLGDLPTTIWWTEDFSATRPLASLVTLGRQLLYDSRRWRDVRSAALALAPLAADRLGPDLADVNWRRLTPLRQALVHAIASSGRKGRQPTTIQIGHRPEDAALAWLLAGWLEGVFDSPVTVQDNPQRDDDILTLSFDDGLELRLGVTSVTVEDPKGPAPFAAAIPQESESEAIAAELRVLTHDASFHAALAALARRFGGA